MEVFSGATLPVNLTITADGLFDATDSFSAIEPQILKAAVRALNKTAIWLKGQAAKQLSQEAQIQQKHLRKKLQVVKANRSNLKAFILANTMSIKAAHLGRMRQTSKGVTVGKHSFDGAFIAKMPGGHTGVFKRKTKARLPIKEMTVKLNKQSLIDLANTEWADKFMHIFAHELKWVTKA